MTAQKANIKVLCIDIDGTLTNGKLYVTPTEEAFKVFDIKDGFGIREILPAKGITPVVITGRNSIINSKRCSELGIKHVYQGVQQKLPVMKQILNELNLSCENAAYIGDDDNDLACMEVAALTACPADASKNVKQAANYISSKNGGDGAVRDFIEWLLCNAST